MTRKKQDDLGAAEVQRKMDKINEQGFVGESTDPTPDENYTVGGVTAAKPTPETDAEASRKAREQVGPPHERA